MKIDIDLYCNTKWRSILYLHDANDVSRENKTK